MARPARTRCGPSRELWRPQPSAKRVVHVGVGAGLVEDEVAIPRLLENLHEPLEERVHLLRRVEVGSGGEVAHPVVRSEPLDDLLGAVTEVHVAIEDEDPPGRAPPPGVPRR